MNKVDHNKVIEIRKSIPCATLQSIADKFGVSREAIRWHLHREGLPTRHVVQKWRCFDCGKILLQKNKTGFCYACLHRQINIPLICDGCGKLFYRRRSVVLRKNPLYKGHSFCCTGCFHKWYRGENWAHLHMSSPRRRRRSYG